MPYVIVAQTGFCEYFLDREGWSQARLRDAATWDSSRDAQKFLDKTEAKHHSNLGVAETVNPLQLRWVDRSHFRAPPPVRSSVGMRLQMRMR